MKTRVFKDKTIIEWITEHHLMSQLEVFGKDSWYVVKRNYPDSLKLLDEAAKKLTKKLAYQHVTLVTSQTWSSKTDFKDLLPMGQTVDIANEITFTLKDKMFTFCIKLQSGKEVYTRLSGRKDIVGVNFHGISVNKPPYGKE
jgi:hypothetical protein